MERLRSFASSLVNTVRRHKIVSLIVALVFVVASGFALIHTHQTLSEGASPNGIYGKGGDVNPYFEAHYNRDTTGGAKSAINWANSYLQGGPNDGESKNYSGWCLAFVANAYGSTWAANSAWDQAKESHLYDPTNATAAPRGALLFFDIGDFGHVGISLGNGIMISSRESASVTHGQHFVIVTDIYHGEGGFWASYYRGWDWPPAQWGPLAQEAANGNNAISPFNGATRPETTGTVAHTWSDYVHAGGSQGPDIPKYQTVNVSCRLEGFQVQDGNTWWYQVATSPWNNDYYATADAFYNNGQTSGPLKGTPFVDTSISLCDQKGSASSATPTPARPTATPNPTPSPVNPPTPTSQPTTVPIIPTPTSPPPPQPTPIPSQMLYPETAGGVAHTWSNYQNAGGNEGQTINAYQTVSMSCRLTGFQVQDDNTWWYRIASPPWNNSFYVSADAFYNNGQTSGPLNNTPFFDPNVPLC